MARSWWLSCQAWIVSAGAFVAVLAGVLVTHLMSTRVMAITLAVPVVIVVAVAAYEWWTARGYCHVLPRPHLLGVVAGLVTWLLYQRAPSGLSFHPSPTRLCAYVDRPTAECLTRAAAARSHSDLAWWLTGVLILMLATLARRSRTAAWSAPAIGFAGGGFALHFVEALIHAYGG